MTATPPDPSGPGPGPGDDDTGAASLRPTYVAIAAAGALMAGVAALEFDAFQAISVGLGAAISVANLWVFARIGRALVGGQGRAAPWAAVGVVKMGVLFGGVYLLLRHHVVAPLALVLGYMALPVGATVASLFATPGSGRPGRPT